MIVSAHIVATGVNQATGVASAGGTLPLNAAGAVPKHVRIVATAAAYVRLGTGAQTAVATDMIVQPGDGVIVPTYGRNNFAALQVAAAGIVQISPMEA